jgi:lysophospholipase L1-like esterase
MTARKKVAAGLALAAALGITACKPVPQNADVYVAGDSITYWAEDELTARLTGTFVVEGIPGINLRDAIDDLVVPAAQADVKTLVLEVGANSAKDGWTTDPDLRDLEAILHAADDVNCVIWVTLGSSRSDLGPRFDAFQASLERRLPQHPNQKLADFSALQIHHVNWFDDDRFHLSQAGTDAYADFVVASLPLCEA